MNISEKIDLLREQRGISLTHLNKAIGAYRGKITDVKSKKASFTEKEIFVLARELSTSTGYLLGNTDDPTPAAQKESPPQIGEPPTIKDWEKALEGKSKEELKEIIEIVMKKFMESE